MWQMLCLRLCGWNNKVSSTWFNKAVLMRNWSNNPWPALNSIPLLIEFKEIFFNDSTGGQCWSCDKSWLWRVKCVCVCVCHWKHRQCQRDSSRLMLSILFPQACSVCTNMTQVAHIVQQKVGPGFHTIRGGKTWCLNGAEGGQLILRGLSLLWSDFSWHLSQHSLFSTKQYDSSALWKLVGHLATELFWG